MDTVSPLLPPAFRLVTLTAASDPVAEAVAGATAGEDGDFFWCDRPDRLDCAVLLHPEQPADPAAVVVHVAMAALGDAIGALAPPVVAVGFGWPDRLFVNAALAGGLRLVTAPSADASAPPPWQVLGVTVAVRGADGDPAPGLRPDTTTLHDEGGVDITAGSLAESFSRHFMAWVHRWQEDGFAPIRESWLSRADGYRQAIDWRLDGQAVAGRFIGLDDEGGLLLADEAAGAGSRTVALTPHLERPSWSLPSGPG